MKDQGLQGPGAGMTVNPSRASTSAAKRPPLSASPTIWGASHRPAQEGKEVAGDAQRGMAQGIIETLHSTGKPRQPLPAVKMMPDT